MNRKNLGLLLLWLCYSPALWAAPEADFMRSTGKFYVVVAVIIAIFVGIIIFLIRIESRLTKLENQILDNE